MEPFYIYGCHYGSVYSFQKVRRKVYLSQSKLEWLISSRGSLSPLFLMWKSLSIHFLPKQGRKFWTSRFNSFPFLFCTLGCSALFPDDFFLRLVTSSQFCAVQPAQLLFSLLLAKKKMEFALYWHDQQLLIATWELCLRGRKPYKEVLKLIANQFKRHCFRKSCSYERSFSLRQSCINFHAILIVGYTFSLKGRKEVQKDKFIFSLVCSLMSKTSFCSTYLESYKAQRLPES